MASRSITNGAHAGVRERKITAKNATPDERRFLEQHKNELSRTTLRAKWIHSPDEHEDRPGQSLATRSHEVIKRWAEERRAMPAKVAGSNADARPRVLRFEFPGYAGGRKLESVSWDDWFKTFDDRHLVFVFQEHMRKGNQSNFFMFDSPKREHD